MVPLSGAIFVSGNLPHYQHIVAGIYVDVAKSLRNFKKISFLFLANLPMQKYLRIFLPHSLMIACIYLS